MVQYNNVGGTNKVFRQYDAETLKRVQQTEKEILIKFISICEKYNLQYFVVFGTLLGTIRHQGFIPWDDDIDVSMPRKDYEKFLKVAEKECEGEYFIQTVDTDPAYHLFFAKMRRCNTKFVENSLQKADSHTGIYIDIIPYDHIPDDEKLLAKQISKTEILVRMLSVSKVKEPQIGDRGKVQNLLAKGIWYFLHYGMKILGISGSFIWKKCEEIYCQYNDVPTERSTSFFADAQKWIIYNEEMDKFLDMPFEDIKVKVPVGYDKILRRCYGEYMELPPVEKRVNHMPVVLQFPGEEEIRW